MIGTEDIVRGGLLPALLAAVAYWSARRAAAKTPAGPAATLPWACALALGFLSGLWALEARGLDPAAAIWKSFRPHEARDWLPLAVVLFALADLVSSAGRFGLAVAWLARPILCGALAWRLLSLHRDYPTSELVKAGLSDSAWSWPQVAALVAGVAGLGALAWTAIRAEPKSPLRAIRCGLATLVAGASAATLALSGSLLYGQLLGVIAATLGGASVAALVTRDAAGPDRAAGPLLGAFGGLLLMGVLFTDAALGPASAAALFAAMFAAVAPAPFRLPARVAESTRAVVCLLLVGLVFASAVRGFQQATEASETAPEAAPNPYDSYR